MKAHFILSIGLVLSLSAPAYADRVSSLKRQFDNAANPTVPPRTAAPEYRYNPPEYVPGGSTHWSNGYAGTVNSGTFSPSLSNTFNDASQPSLSGTFSRSN